MPLKSGDKIGPYRVNAMLGKGGMGEVYSAVDPRLGRQVAIKVLPDALSSDPERLRRFEQEARAAASLNHPNIVAIYDVGAEGSPYIVSELLEGETLRQRLDKGQFPIRQALEMGALIAEALSAAHEKGIVHRDLKPENLFLTQDGRLKVLDFGLAKLSPRQDSNSRMLTELQTAEGFILGTIGYMSPEQVRGLAVDHRSDLFSLGAILFEMITGRRAFSSGTAVETMSAILNAEPEFSLGSGLPEVVERILRHCLEKDPRQRFQSARDLAFSLEGVKDISGRTASPSTPPVFHQITFRRGTIWSARFAPDGSTIIYGGCWEGEECRLFLTRTESTESLPLNIASADILSISASGEMAISLGRRYDVGYTNRGTLARAPLIGGAPRPILEDIQEADWLPGGKQLMVVRSVEGKYCIEFPIGHVVYRTVGWLSHARVSPDGTRVAFLEHPLYGDDAGFVSVVDSGGRYKKLTHSMITIHGLAWRNSEEIWFTGAHPGLVRQLHAVTVDGTMRPVLLVPAALTLHDISPSGAVLFNHESYRREIVVETEDGKQRNLSWLNWSFPRDMTRDGKCVLFLEQASSGGGSSVVLRNTDGSPPILLDNGIATSFTEDEKSILNIPGPSPRKVHILPVGVGEPKVLDNDNIDIQSALAMPDGRQLILVGVEEGKLPRLYLQSLAGGKPQPCSEQDVMVQNFLTRRTIKPGGDAVVCWNRDRALAIYPLNGGAPSVIPDSQGQMVAGWSDDGKLLYVYSASELPGRIFQMDPATGRKELFRTIEPPEPAGINGLSPIIFSQDMKTCVYSYRRIISDLFVATGLR